MSFPGRPVYQAQFDTLILNIGSLNAALFVCKRFNDVGRDVDDILIVEIVHRRHDAVVLDTIDLQCTGFATENDFNHVTAIATDSRIGLQRRKGTSQTGSIRLVTGLTVSLVGAGTCIQIGRRRLRHFGLVHLGILALRIAGRNGKQADKSRGQ